jgi:hypothetical protein
MQFVPLLQRSDCSDAKQHTGLMVKQKSMALTTLQLTVTAQRKQNVPNNVERAGPGGEHRFVQINEE